MKKIIFLAVAAVLVLAGAGCQEKSETPAANENLNVNKAAANTNAEAPVVNAPYGEEEAGGVALVAYTNKSMGYDIMRPDRWYWQHYVRSEISEAMPGVIDLFVTDPNPLPSLGSQYLGRIVIEVSTRSLDELEGNYSDLTRSSATVAGISATKYAGVRTNEVVQNQKYINYIFVRDGKTYRISYSMKNSTAEDEEVFQSVVDSFSF